MFIYYINICIINRFLRWIHLEVIFSSIELNFHIIFVFALVHINILLLYIASSIRLYIVVSIYGGTVEGSHAINCNEPKTVGLRFT